MDGSEAKAIIKGAMRRAGHRWDKFEATYMADQEADRPMFKTRKKFLRYVDDLMAWRGDLLIHHLRVQQPSSWHQKIELAAITSEYEEVEGIGAVAKIAVCFYDSRQFFKGNVQAANSHYLSRVYLHEHFLQRMVLRYGVKGIGEIGKIVYPLLHALMDNFTSLRNLEEDFYLVSDAAVMTIKKCKALDGVLLKTVLLRDRFSSTQAEQFSSVYQRIDAQGDDQHRRMVIYFPTSKRMIDVNDMSCSLLSHKQHCDNTIWLHNIRHDFAC